MVKNSRSVVLVFFKFVIQVWARCPGYFFFWFVAAGCSGICSDYPDAFSNDLGHALSLRRIS